MITRFHFFEIECELNKKARLNAVCGASERSPPFGADAEFAARSFPCDYLTACVCVPAACGMLGCFLLCSRLRSCLRLSCSTYQKRAPTAIATLWRFDRKTPQDCF